MAFGMYSALSEKASNSFSYFVYTNNKTLNPVEVTADVRDTNTFLKYCYIFV